MKQLRKRDLLAALSGRPPTGEAVGSPGSFDGGARRNSLPVEETHEELLARVLVSREADVGRAL
jgi:hypothetical protein